MKLIIRIENNVVSVILTDKKTEIARESFHLDNNLTEKLLPTIDALLDKKKIQIKDIKKAELKCNVPDSYTTYRIAKVVVDTINWAKQRI